MKETLPISQDLVGKLWFSEIPRLNRLHRHDELECNLIVSGQGAYLLRGHRVDLRPDTILWLFPEQEHVLLKYAQQYDLQISIHTWKSQSAAQPTNILFAKMQATRIVAGSTIERGRSGKVAESYFIHYRQFELYI